MRGISLDQMIGTAISDLIGHSMMSCIFIDTATPRYIAKLKQGIQYYTKHRRFVINGRRKVLFNRMIASLRITDGRNRSVLA